MLLLETGGCSSNQNLVGGFGGPLSGQQRTPWLPKPTPTVGDYLNAAALFFGITYFLIFFFF